MLRAGPYSQPDRLGACWEERKDLSYEYAIRGYRGVQARGVRGELAPAARGKAACTLHRVTLGTNSLLPGLEESKWPPLSWHCPTSLS